MAVRASWKGDRQMNSADCGSLVALEVVHSLGFAYKDLWYYDLVFLFFFFPLSQNELLIRVWLMVDTGNISKFSCRLRALVVSLISVIRDSGWARRKTAAHNYVAAANRLP